MSDINKKLFDDRACSHTLGCLLLDPTLIDDINKPLDRNDFCGERFYEILYVAIYNLVMQGIEVIDSFSISSYLKDYKEQYTVFESNNGESCITQLKGMSSLSNYDYFYHRMRKFSLLRYYEEKGLDVKFIYDWTLDDIDGRELRKFDEMTEEDIIDKIENEFSIIPKMKFASNSLIDERQAGKGMWELIQSFMEVPDFGYPMISPAINTIARGARKGKFYLFSGDTGSGKTRQFIMNACFFSVPYIYDKDLGDFRYTGNCVPATYVGTEGSLNEYTTIAAATIAKVNERKILEGTCTDEELNRLKQATMYVEQSPLYFIYISDFSITDIENIAKKYVYQKQIEIFIFDYIQSSLRLSQEINGKGKAGLKEHQMLLVFSTRLKALSERLNICVISGTQLSPGESKDAKYKDQRILAGSKSQANKVDLGVVWSTPNESEKKKIEKITRKIFGCPEINLLCWIYKARSGALTRIIIHCHKDLGTMTIEDCFVTDFDFNLIQFDFTNIEVVEQTLKEHSKEMTDEDFEEIEAIEKEQDNKKWKFDF